MIGKAEKTKKRALPVAAIIAAFSAGGALIFSAALLPLSTGLRIFLLGIALLPLAGGVVGCLVRERQTACYACPCCGARFRPTLQSTVSGPHTFRKRKLKCPQCGEISYCRKEQASARFDR